MVRSRSDSLTNKQIVLYMINNWWIFVVAECQGTATLRTIQQRSGQEERYEEYRKRYENCTLISDNLEIVHIELSDAKYDFSFLDTIREVNGYVLIYGNHVDRIRLNGLRVIRGWNTVPKVVHNVTRNVSLYVAWNHDENETTIGLKELQLTSLVGASFYYVILFFVFICINQCHCIEENSDNKTNIEQRQQKP